MAFCTTRTRFAAGWFGGGNARRFAAMAQEQDDPMGVVALMAGRAVGWIACGPRSRYSGAVREDVLRDRRGPDAASDWFLPCVFVAAGHRRAGVSHALVRAAVELGRERGATTVEGWPLAASVQDQASAFVGREQVFADLGFRRVAAPTRDRVLMRLDLGPPDPR